MHKLLDILASGIHDAKNQLFLAEARIAACEHQHGIDLGEARYALEAAANRLNQSLTAYRLMRQDTRLALIPTVVGDLCADIALDQQAHLAKSGIILEVDCQALDEWPLDRDLVGDMLNNALQNAGRYARQRIRLSAGEDEQGLWLRVDDDGPGFTEIPPPRGTGLQVAARLAELHVRHGRAGQLALSNASPLGGARFELRLP